MNDSKKNNNSKNENIKLYPFNGRSPYLIDRFYIIGYNYSTLHQLLIEHTPVNIEESKDVYLFNLEEEPSILNEIVSDYKKESLPNELILKMILPKKIVFCLYKDNSQNEPNSNDNYCKIEFNLKQKTPKGYRVFFSSNPQTENNSKKSINGFAYIFYRKFLEKKIIDNNRYIYYVPYIFCIISEFPYFAGFSELCKFINNLYAQDEITLPIEFLISNIVTLTPSPIKSDVILNLSLDPLNDSNISLEDKKDDDIKGKEEFNSTKTNVLIHSSNKQRLSLNIKKDTKSTKNTRLHRVMTNYQINNDLNNPVCDKIMFQYLSGYPLIQYNLSSVLFRTLTPDKIITIFLYTFLEKDVLFFSNNIENLTLTINAFINLNFPLNDEKYYFIGAAVSFMDFSYGNSEFGLKNYTSIIGINDKYRHDYKNKNLKMKDHLVVDLDKGEIHQGVDENDNTVNENNQKLTKLIKKLYDEKEDSKHSGNILYQSIKKLGVRLKKIYEMTSDLNSKVNSNKSFVNNKISKLSEKCKEIQEVFYEFIYNVCFYFYDNLSIKMESGNNLGEKSDKADDNKIIFFNKESAFEKAVTEEEKIFLNELGETMKFQSFVYSFLQTYNPIDLFKIPLIFTEEFLSIYSRKKEIFHLKKKTIPFFSLIDSLYNSYKEEKKIVSPLNIEFLNEIKDMFNREIYDKSRIKYHNSNNMALIHFINNQDENSTNKDNRKALVLYQTYELDDNLLLKYFHFIKNLNNNECKNASIYTLPITYNNLYDIKISQIENIMENYCIKNEILSNSDICCENIILLFIISLKSLGDSVNIKFLFPLFQKCTIFRKYYSLLLNIIYRLYQNKEINTDTITLCYLACSNSLKNQKLVPNEDLMNMINQLNINNIFGNSKEKQENHNIKNKLLEMIPITKDNLYVYNNFTSYRFVKEKEIVKNVNMKIRSEETDIVLETGEKIIPKIRFNNGQQKFESFFVSQRLILQYLFKEYCKYIVNLNDKNLGTKILLDACINIIIFMRNNDDFKDKSDLFSIVQSIFYTFIKQLN